MIPSPLGLSFRVGDKVVYPNHGVGTIEQISTRYLTGCSQQFYLLKIESSNLRVMVPFTNVGSVGMRPIAKASDVSKIIDFLQEGECRCHSDWKCRFKENSEKMRTGSLLQVAEVLKSLLQLIQLKPLSFREKKMLDRAISLLVDELASVRHVRGTQALDIIQRALSKANLSLPVQAPAEA